MIFHDIEFIKPRTVSEALEAYAECRERDLAPEYFSGGTELVTMARDGKVGAKAFIDLKGIEVTQVVERADGVLRMGSSATLNRLIDLADFPLFSACAEGVADHTVRNSITLGGNIAGKLPYREAMLPLLLLDAQAIVAGLQEGGQATKEPAKMPLRRLFDKRLRIPEGAFLVAFEVSESAASGEFWYHRWVRSSRVDYPIVTLVAIASNDELLFATAGSLAYPVWGGAQSADLRGISSQTAAEGTIETLGKLRADARASSEYRRALLIRGLVEAAEALS